MAGWYYLDEQYDSALSILQWLEKFPPEEILPLQFCYLYNNISLIHSTIGNYKIALDYLHKGLAITPDLAESNYIKAHILRNLGWTYREQGEFGTAEKYYQQALAYAQQWDDKENLWLIYLEMGELYQKQGDIPMMRKYLLEGYQLKDQVQSQQNLQRSFLLNRDLELATAPLSVISGFSPSSLELSSKWLGKSILSALLIAIAIGALLDFRKDIASHIRNERKKRPFLSKPDANAR